MQHDLTSSRFRWLVFLLFAVLQLGIFVPLWADVNCAGSVKILTNRIPRAGIDDTNFFAPNKDLPALRKEISKWKQDLSRRNWNHFLVISADGLPDQRRAKSILRLYFSALGQAGLNPITTRSYVGAPFKIGFSIRRFEIAVRAPSAQVIKALENYKAPGSDNIHDLIDTSRGGTLDWPTGLFYARRFGTR